MSTQGAPLIGIYDSQVAFGQSRVLLVWTRLIMPNGRSIVLVRQQGADPVVIPALRTRSTIIGRSYSEPPRYRRCLASARDSGPAQTTAATQHFCKPFGWALLIH
jgi:hypothetical protein